MAQKRMGKVTDKVTQLKELRALLSRKLEVEGWENPRQFQLKSGIPMSLETVRRMFLAPSGKEDRGMDAATLAIGCRYLGFEANEIRDILRTYTDDQELWQLIGGSGPVMMTAADRSLMLAIKEVLAAKPELTKSLADQIDLLAGVAGVDVSEHTKAFRRRKG